MPDPNKPLKRALQALVERAYEAELRGVLMPLAVDFDAWRAGRLDIWKLTDRIHAFHDGPNRELWKRYSNPGSMTERIVAHAIVTGILDRSTLPPDVLDHLADLIASYEGDRED